MRRHHEVVLDEGPRDFLAGVRDDGRPCEARGFTRIKLASQAEQAEACQSIDGDSGTMLFVCEHAGQVMVIGGPALFQPMAEGRQFPFYVASPYQGLTLA